MKNDDHGDLHSYATGDYLRPATADEAKAAQAEVDDGNWEGIILVDGRSCYVE